MPEFGPSPWGQGVNKLKLLGYLWRRGFWLTLLGPDGAACRGRAALVAGLLAAGPAAAEPPPADFFTGRYSLVGRDDAEPPALVDGSLYLAPEGEGLAVTTCDGPAGRLDFASMFETDNYLTGRIGRWEGLWCMFHNDGGNYAILNCATEDGVRVTLWPAAEPGATGPDCEGGTPVGR
jgi:hypothetical protein